jgi:hypothetical protein
MIKYLISRKGIILIVIPVFALFLQIFLRLILKKDLNTVGISLGALGLGQILPFFYFDHFVANKILGISPEFNIENDELLVKYKVKKNATISEGEIEKVKNTFVIAVFLNLTLFLCIVYFGLTGDIMLHTLLGLVSCIISWYLIVFKY